MTIALDNENVRLRVFSLSGKEGKRLRLQVDVPPTPENYKRAKAALADLIQNATALEPTEKQEVA